MYTRARGYWSKSSTKLNTITTMNVTCSHTKGRRTRFNRKCWCLIHAVPHGFRLQLDGRRGAKEDVQQCKSRLVYACVYVSLCKFIAFWVCVCMLKSLLELLPSVSCGLRYRPWPPTSDDWSLPLEPLWARFIYRFNSFSCKKRVCYFQFFKFSLVRVISTSCSLLLNAFFMLFNFTFFGNTCISSIFIHINIFGIIHHHNQFQYFNKQT